MLNIHKNIEAQLTYYHSTQRIPNIIFNGPSGVGKSTLLHNFLMLIYDNDKSKMREMCMYVNCAHGKGIKFIRDELKFFAKTNINTTNGKFKSIVLINGDKLTTDAQSALRRCIELFTFNTRFFIIVEDKNKMLTPVLSRFCEINIPEPLYRGKPINLYKHRLNNIFDRTVNKKKLAILTQHLYGLPPSPALTSMVDISARLVSLGFSAIDVHKLIEDGIFNDQLSELGKYKLLMHFDKIRRECRDEKTLMLTLLISIFMPPTPM
jgi:hypothetical protein